MKQSYAWVLINPATKNFIAIDPASGGYPYEVDHLAHAKLWIDIIDCHKYRNTVNEPSWYSLLVKIEEV